MRDLQRIPTHVIGSLLALVWLLVALALEIVKSAIRVVWFLLAWFTGAFMTFKNPLRGPLYWKWTEIDLDDLAFPDDFIWGVATAAHQIEGGCDNNNWAAWENVERDPPPIKGNQRVGEACDHWNRLEEDTELISKLGVKSYRFSIEWSKIEPTPGQKNEDAIRHYHKELDLLEEAGIMPMLTLLHFTHPIWFEEMGAFEKEENNKHFIKFALDMYKEFGGRVKWWCTLNEPEVQTANSYVTGMFPPGGLGWLNTAGRVLRNLLICHVEIYYAIKEEAAAKGLEVKVGIVKDLFQFHSHRWHNLFDHFLAWQCNQLFNHQIIRFLKTGRFHYWVPFASSVSHFDERAPSANDFVGLNYYSKFMTNFSNVLFNSNLEEKLSVNQHEIISDMPQQAIYAEGLYSAIREMASIGHPVIVTENGIADASDTLRALYIRRYIYAMSRAIADGYPVAGYYYWALYDNFEWCLGYIPRFGLYHVDFDTQVRTLRPSAEHFTAIVKKFYEGELRTDKAGGGPEEQDTKPHVSAALVAVPQVSDEGGIELEDVPL